MEIEIRREWLWAVGIVLALVVLGGIGSVVSPRDESGRPLLLLPGVRAVETYRRQAVAWAQDWRELDNGLRGTLESTDTGLLTQSQQAQSNFEQAVALARNVEQTDAPPALLGLREQAVQTATAYVDASAAINRWLSAPSGENRTAAQEIYRQASEALARLESNEWIGIGTPTITAPR